MQADRRKFLKNASQLAAGLGMASLPGIHSLAQRPSFPHPHPADPVRVGLIGCNNMGWWNLNSLLNHEGVVCTALCDVDNNVLTKRAAELEKRSKSKALLFADYRQMLAGKDIDAVIIGTPDHWHCLQMVEACAAGKDVYVEKPIANSIEECNLMVAAARKYNRVVQVGQWQRSDPHWIAALAYLQSGVLGKIRHAKAWAYVGYGKNFGVKPDGPVPPGVDYNMWLGPAPQRPFNPNRFHGSFRYFWDYAGGLMTDWGVHMIDMVLAGMRASYPLSVSAAGGKYAYPDSVAETPDTLQAVYDFGNFSMLWEQALGTGRAPYNRAPGAPGVAFIGTKGTRVVDRESWEVIPEVEGGKFLTEAMPVQRSTANGLDAHTKNWLDCIRSRKETACTIEMGRASAINAQLGNIAYRSGAKVSWDANRNEIINDPSAQRLTKAVYRAPWKLPKI